MAKTASSRSRDGIVLEPPSLHVLPLVHATEDVRQWLDMYWIKLGINAAERSRLALTQDRREFARWTGRRLNSLALGCYCYLPDNQDEPARNQAALAHRTTDKHPPHSDGAAQMALPGLEVLAVPASPPTTSHHRHLIFIDPDLLPLGREVTVAHELIHLADRARGRPRRHHCHGYDAIAVDEAAITGRDPELLRQLLRDETARREAILRQSRPIKYLYVCPNCQKEYPRVKRYARPVSCGACDRSYNPNYLLVLQAEQVRHLAATTDELDDEIFI